MWWWSGETVQNVDEMEYSNGFVLCMGFSSTVSSLSHSHEFIHTLYIHSLSFFLKYYISYTTIHIYLNTQNVAHAQNIIGVFPVYVEQEISNIFCRNVLFSVYIERLCNITARKLVRT